MTEAEFWVELEFRLCKEFAGLAERRYRYFWCDGLIAENYELDTTTPRIVGRAWIGNGSDQHQWRFTLHLRQPAPTLQDVDWGSLLPADNVTCWMSFDESERSLEIDPGAAKPDLK
jgi:hypothetical protein